MVKAMRVVKSEGYIWPWKFKVKVKVKPTGPIWCIEFDMFAFHFVAIRPFLAEI